VSSKIVIALGSGPHGHDAVELGTALAALTGAPATVVDVFPFDDAWSGIDLAGAGAALRKEAEDAVARVAAALGERGVAADGEAIGDHRPARALYRLTEREDVGLIVLGATHRGRLGRMLRGGVADQMLHGAACAVAVAPSGYTGPAGPPEIVGVGYADTPEGREALSAAIALAERTGARLRIVSVAEPQPWLDSSVAPGYGSPELEKAHREALRGALEEAVASVPESVATESALLDGDAAGVLAHASADMDLLVVGSRGYGPVGAVLLGSVSHPLMHRSACPVIVVPRGGERSFEDLLDASREAVG